MVDVFPIKIISKQDQNILAEFSFKDLDKAYQQALAFEDLGLDIELNIPGATASLAQSLKIPAQQFQKLEQEFKSEIEDHNH
jgi:hypothetical protein